MSAVAELYMHSQNMLSIRMVFKECHVWKVLPCSEPTYLYQTCQQYTGKEMSLPFREASEWQNRTSVLLYVHIIFDTYVHLTVTPKWPPMQQLSFGSSGFPTVDDAFAWAFLLGLERGGITARGLCQAVCLALNALH